MSDAIIDMINFKQDVKNNAEIEAYLLDEKGEITKSLKGDVMIKLEGSGLGYDGDVITETTVYKITGVEEIKRYYL